MTEDQPDWTQPRGSTERTDSDRLIVSCGIGRHYRERLRSTINHCEVHCPETWKLWYDVLPEDSPEHAVNQYAFKIHAIQRAIDAGFRYILWIDTAFQPVAAIEPIWKHVAEVGCYAPRQGSSMLGSWTTDEALCIYGITRNAAMEIPLVYSGLVGFDMQHPTGKAVWEFWRDLYRRGAFVGPHFNRPSDGQNFLWECVGAKWRGHCSFDPRCEGHRHDEAALAYSLHAWGIVPETKGWLTIEDPVAGIIGHHVPDFDVVAMRQACQKLAMIKRELYGEIGEAERLKALCR